MLESIIEFDYNVTLAINGGHTAFLDSMMHFLSGTTVWIPLYVIIAALMFIPKFYSRKSLVKNYSSTPFWLIGIIGLIFVLACFGLTDQISSFIKDGVQRLRPGHDPNLEGLLHLPDGKGGLYGFVSSHAANTFALALLTSLIFRRYLYSIFIFLWASAVSFSRIYLARHFLTDIVCGAIVGLLIALAIYFLWSYILKSINKHYNKKCSVS